MTAVGAMVLMGNWVFITDSPHSTFKPSTFYIFLFLQIEADGCNASIHCRRNAVTLWHSSHAYFSILFDDNDQAVCLLWCPAVTWPTSSCARWSRGTRAWPTLCRPNWRNQRPMRTREGLVHRISSASMTSSYRYSSNKSLVSIKMSWWFEKIVPNQR